MEPFGIDPQSFEGYVHDSGQPTAHFSVLESKGIDPRRIIVDTTAPLYHVGTDENYAPMLILVSDNDMGNRCEQTQLLVSTLKQFGMPEEKICFKIMNGRHCQHTLSLDENGNSVIGVIIEEFIHGRESNLSR